MKVNYKLTLDSNGIEAVAHEMCQTKTYDELTSLMNRHTLDRGFRAVKFNWERCSSWNSGGPVTYSLSISDRKNELSMTLKVNIVFNKSGNPMDLTWL